MCNICTCNLLPQVKFSIFHCTFISSINCKLLKWYYDQKIISLFSSDPENVFA